MSIVANDAAAGEPANNGQFTVSLSAASSTDTVVSYTVGGTATAGMDYTALTGSVTILAGQLSALIDVTVLNDVVVEGNETVTVTLNSITSGDADISINGAASSDTVTIADDGDTAQVSILANDAAAGEPANNGQFTVSLSAPSSTDTVISYTVGGTATAGADYTALTGSVTILAGQLSALIDVTVLNDILVEGNETVTVTLNSITSGDPDISINGAANSDTVTIADDGDTATVTLVANDAAAGEPANPGQFTVDLGQINSTGAPILVSYSVLGSSSATAGADYTALAGTVAILAGQQTATIDVTVLDDALVEGNETVTVQLTGTGTAGVGVDATARTVTIADDGDTANAVLSVTIQGDETGPVAIVFTVTLSQVNSTGTAITFELDDLLTGSAASGLDYTAIPANAQITVANGANSGSLSVAVTDDANLEALETLDAQISGSSNAAVLITGANATASITDNETATVSIIANDPAAGEPANPGQFTVSLSQVSSVDTTISYTVAGSAASGTDYTALSGTVTILAGNLTATIDVSVIDDLLPEPSKSVIVTLQAITAGAPGISVGAPVAATVTIADDDATPVNTVPGPQTVAEDIALVFSTGGGNAVVVADPDTGILTVTLAVTNGTLTLNGVAGLAFTTGDGTADATMTFSGTVAAINAALDGMAYQPAANYNGPAQLDITTSDGNTNDTDTVNIGVTAVNDAPVNVVPGPQIAAEDTPLAIGGISITDVEGNVTSVTLAVANGTLNVAAAGAAGVVGNGSGSVTISGTQADINATLASLGYQGNLNFNGPDTLAVTSTDSNGATDTDNVAITVTAVNDVPANTVPGAQAGAEDTPLAISGLSITDPDGTMVAVTLSVANGTLTVSLAGGATISAGANGSATLTLNGTVAQVNAALASLGYLGAPNYNGGDTLTMTATDPSAASDTDTVAINLAAVNDAPTIGANTFTINDGGTLVLGSGNLSATDVDDAAGSLVFTVGGVSHGSFVLVSTGAPVTSFTQADIAAGLVRFVHDGSGQAPAFTIYAADASGGGAGPVTASITFNGGGTIFTTPPTGSGGGGGTTAVLPPLPPPAAATTTPGAPGASAFFRTPTVPAAEGGDEEVATPVLATPATTAASVDKRIVAEMGLPPIRVEPDVIETKPLRSDIDIEPVRAEMQVIPTRHDLELDEEERARIDVVLSSVRITGLAFSVGAVWWAARAAGLIASLLASSPAWRHVDPLPVLGRDEQDEEEHDVADEDQERKDDEHRAAWVLEERG